MTWLSAGLAGETQAQERTVPNFASANFGWLVNTGFGYRPVEGTVAPIGADSNWRGGIGLPTSDFNYQPPEAAADLRRQGPSRTGPWNIERLSDAENMQPLPGASLKFLTIKAIDGFKVDAALWQPDGVQPDRSNIVVLDDDVARLPGQLGERAGQDDGLDRRVPIGGRVVFDLDRAEAVSGGLTGSKPTAPIAVVAPLPRG